MNKFVVGLCTAIELGCIVSLAAIGLKRNNDCYKAECKAIGTECKLLGKELELWSKDLEIKILKEELAELKGDKEEA